MRRYFKYIVFILALVEVSGCRELYDPALKPAQNGYLVVDGIIVNGKHQTVITLTRTTAIHDSVNIVYEQNATVQVEGEDNSVYLLTEKENGQYTADSLDLTSGITYRLKINTSDGNKYMSDYVPVLSAPSIDSVSYIQKKDPDLSQIYNFDVYVNTHDPLNNTRYYLWNYEETWKYHSPVKSYVELINDSVMYISQENQDKLYNCWKSEQSKSILIGNTVKLSQDVISMKPLTSVEGNSIKKSFIYSINVMQYALTQEAYEFYDKMRQNSEQTGSFFDPQPSEIRGNIHNSSNQSELVIGYVSISTRAEKRIYISKKAFYYYPAGCETQNLNFLEVYRINYPTYYPVNYIISLQTFRVTGYVIAPRECVDCEKLGGSNIKPGFWPDSL